VDSDYIRKKFGLDTVPYDAITDMDAVVLINGHDEFKQIRLEDLKGRMRTPVLMDVKNFFSRKQAAELGFEYTSL